MTYTSKARSLAQPQGHTRQPAQPTTITKKQKTTTSRTTRDVRKATTVDSLISALDTFDSFVWGPFLLIPLLLGCGAFLTIRLKGLQFRALGRAFRHGLIDGSDEGSGDITNYQALTMALAATVGVGNIVGVATAISIGGPGALFWMWITGVIAFILVGTVLLGGVQSIARVTSAFVPMMIIIYIVGAIIVLIAHAHAIPGALHLIFTDAFTGTAATGGFVGSGILLVIQMGVARGLFSNESGLGSAPIAAAAAQTTHPVRQGLVSMTQTFIDTIIVVSFTGLVIICTGTWNADVSAGNMTAAAFSAGLPGQWGGTIVSISVVFFAFSTILGWSYYGERCLTRLIGPRTSIIYRMIFTMVVFVGATTSLTVVWTIADILNGLMALPNLIGLLVLSGLIARETAAYLKFDPKLKATPEEVRNYVKAEGTGWT